MISGADTAFVLAAAGLVLLMTPGLALFYGGMVRKKNVRSEEHTSELQSHSFISYAVFCLKKKKK